jgi:hypothetical protein
MTDSPIDASPAQRSHDVLNHFLKSLNPLVGSHPGTLESLESRMQLAGDLAVTVGTPTLKFSPSVQNDLIKVPVTITNVGDETVTARFRLFLFLSNDRTVGSDYVYNAIERLHPIRPGQSFTPDVTSAMPHDPLGIVNGTALPAGQYFIRAFISFLDGASDANSDNNSVFSTGSVGLNYSIGGGTGKTKQRTVTIPTGPFQQLKFEIIGPGDGVVTSTGAGVLGSLSVATTGTTRTSSLLIRTNEKFLPGSVANITVSGSLQRLQIPEINVTGNISISGGLRFINARSISGSTWSIGGTEALDARLGTVVNTSLSSTGDIANMTVASWTTDDGGTDALVARSIRRLVVDGNFAPRIGASAGVNAITIAGAANSFMDVTGSVTRFSAGSTGSSFVLNATRDIGSVEINGNMQGRIAAATIGSVLIRGSMNSASVFAGTSLGSNGDIGGTGTAADVFGAGSLGTLTVRGSATNSLVTCSLDHVNGQFFTADDRFRSTSSQIGRIRIVGATFNTNFAAVTFGPSHSINGLTIIPGADARFRSDFPTP